MSNDLTSVESNASETAGKVLLFNKGQVKKEHEKFALSTNYIFIIKTTLLSCIHRYKVIKFATTLRLNNIS